MFDIGWSELVVIGIVALIAIGPKELPGVLRSLGQWMGKIRRMASDFQDQFREAMREAEMTDLKKQFDDVSGAATSMTSGFENPLDSARKEVEKALGEEPASDAAPSRTESSGPAATDAPATASEAAGAADTPAEAKPEEVARSGSSAA